jgi:hypothetical protein
VLQGKTNWDKQHIDQMEIDQNGFSNLILQKLQAYGILNYIIIIQAARVD